MERLNGGGLEGGLEPAGREEAAGVGAEEGRTDWHIYPSPRNNGGEAGEGGSGLGHGGEPNAEANDRERVHREAC